jgi:glycosyltransferase involved in cell wall biosynthesis
MPVNVAPAGSSRAGKTMSRDLRVSIIIVNYNYGRFLGAAIDSALRQSWNNVEVLVVDDGSTDNSAEVIARYGDRIKPYCKENGGQSSVYSDGFARATGRLAIFLDADDVLYPDWAATSAAYWRPGVSKIQGRMDTVDAEGRDLNLAFPYYAPDLSPAEIKRRCLTFGFYPWVVASGNAFDRDFLARTLPVPDLFRNIADGYLSKLAPLYGEVVTIQKIAGAYRIHGGNVWAQSDAVGSKYALATRYELDMSRVFVNVAASLGYRVDQRLLQLNKSYLEPRLLSRRFAPDLHPVPGESIWNIVALGIESAWISPELTRLGRVLWGIWFVIIGVLPLPILRYLLRQFRMQSFRTNLARKLVAWSRAPPTAATRQRPEATITVRPQRVSIVIINYNYGRFLREAIESALGQTWRDVEVVVVDDGSTDNSRAIIEAFFDRIRAVFKPNGGHTSALNEGFAASNGKIVIFLDADDRLHSRCVETVLTAWRQGVAKIQYRLNTIDRAGCNLGMPFPHYGRKLRSDPEEAGRQMVGVGSYSYPVSSGNAFSSSFLARILPIDAIFRRAPDGLLNRLAPLSGSVITLPDILGDYRVHGANVLAQERLDPTKFATNIKYEIEREGYFRDQACALGCVISPKILLRNKSYLETRLLSLRLTPNTHPVPSDRALHLAWLGIRSAFVAPDLRNFGKLIWSLWFLWLGILPSGIVGLLARNLRLQSRRVPIAKVLISLAQLSVLLALPFDQK